MAYTVNNNFKPNDKKNNILKWWFEIQDTITVSPHQGIAYEPASATKKLSEATCLFLGTMELKPWKGFSVENYIASDGSKRVRPVNKSIPSWWSSYNNVKHNRISLAPQESEKPNYSKANLGNLIHALGALYLLEKAYMESIGTQDDIESFFDDSRLFVKREFISSSDIVKMFEV